MKIISLFGRPTFLRAFHGWSIIAWAIIWGLAVPLGWIDSIAFISHVTIVTALLTSFAAWCAARVEVKQDEQIDEQGSD
jgi:hypothetical protein